MPPQKASSSFAEDLARVQANRPTSTTMEPVSSRSRSSEDRPNDSGFLSGILELGKGAAKGVGRNIIDLAFNPAGPVGGRTVSSFIPDVQPEGGREQFGAVLGDALMTLPASLAAGGAPISRNIARGFEQRALGGVPARVADAALDARAELVTRGNAQRLAGAATEQYGGPMVKRGGAWVPNPEHLAKSPTSQAAAAMKTQAGKKMAPITPMEVAVGAMGSGILGPAGAIAGGYKLINRPLPSSVVAMLLNRAGPKVQAAGAATGLTLSEALIRQLSGGGQ